MLIRLLRTKSFFLWYNLLLFQADYENQHESITMEKFRFLNYGGVEL